MTLPELLAAVSTSGVGGAAIKSGFDYLRAKGGLQLTAEQRLWKRVDQLEQHIRACDERNDALVTQIADLRAQNAGQARQINDLQVQNAAQAQAIARVTERAEKAEGQALALHQELAALRRQIR